MNIHMYFLKGVILLAAVMGSEAVRAQSLGEMGRAEAERRRRLEVEGVTAKVIDGHDPQSLGRGGNLSVFSPTHGSRAFGGVIPRDRGSPVAYRNQLQRLDRALRQTEARLAVLRTRVAEARWALPKTGHSRNSGRESSEHLRYEIQSLEAKVKGLRDDRLRIYDAGLKAGFLPGELDGRGIIP